jgi:hypothetical protein
MDLRPGPARPARHVPRHRLGTWRRLCGAMLSWCARRLRMWIEDLIADWEDWYER